MKKLIGSLILSACLIAPGIAAPTALLITSDELEDAWKPFVEWKAKQGKPTKVITTEEILQGL